MILPTLRLADGRAGQEALVVQILSSAPRWLAVVRLRFDALELCWPNEPTSAVFDRRSGRGRGPWRGWALVAQGQTAAEAALGQRAALCVAQAPNESPPPPPAGAPPAAGAAADDPRQLGLFGGSRS